MRRFVDGFQMLDFDHAVEHQFAETLEETAWALGADQEKAVQLAIDADHFVERQQPAGQQMVLIGDNADRQRMIVEQLTNLRQGSDGGDAAGGHDGDVIGQLFQLFQFVAGNQQTFASLRQCAEQPRSIHAGRSGRCR